jgi:hypothetical protein
MSKKNVKHWKLKVSKEQTYSVYFKLLNGMLKLTNKEILVASSLFNKKHDIDGSVTDSGIANRLLFSVDIKKGIRNELGMSALLFNNYIQSLKEKGVIMETDDGKALNPSLEIHPGKALDIGFKLSIDA